MSEVVSTSARNGHGLGKDVSDQILLIAGQGVEGDAHCGELVKHRSRVTRDPTQPNLRQVHLIHAELLDEVTAKGFNVAPGVFGENILTRGIDLLGLSQGTQLAFPSGASIQITGLRNPCQQLNAHSKGLMAALLDRAADGSLIRKGGIMSVVLAGGIVQRGDPIKVMPPAGNHMPLSPV